MDVNETVTLRRTVRPSWRLQLPRVPWSFRPLRWPSLQADDCAAILAYLFLGLWVMALLLADPTAQTVAANRQDTLLFEWVLAHAARVVTDGVDPFSTDLMNLPNGVNLLANTSILGLGIPLAPLTLLAGPQYSLALLLVLAPTATAASWYLVLTRQLSITRSAAFAGGLFCGFSPAMISQNTAHPNVTAQFLLPLIVLTVLRLRTPGRAVRRGLELAALVVVQAFINEELLFLTALALGVFVLVLGCLRPAEILPHVAGALKAFAVTALVAGSLLAYPLSRQFFGPMAYHGVPVWARAYGTDLAAFPAYATESLGGSAEAAADLAQGAVEENTFFGWGLLLLVALIVAWQRRDRVVVSLAVTGGVFAVLSLGPAVTFRGEPTEVPGPWSLLSDLPIADSVVPTRMGLLLTPIIGLLIAISLNRLVQPDAGQVAAGRLVGDRLGGDRRLAARMWVGAIAVALVPLAPTPITVSERPPAPVFFSSGLWQEHLPPGAVVVPVAPGWSENLDVMQWQLAADLGFATSGGYFLAPVPGSADQAGAFGPARLPTAAMLVEVAASNASVIVTDAQRQQAQTDLRYWQATTLVMREDSSGADAVRATVDQLVGPGQRIGDVWLWDVRGS
ncbi:MAG: hypothetical protein JXA67_09840 [Micromonosporaceae bacterium]|nr:hypothetical protein [Micromonosporaceae bacterium]